MSRPYGVTGSRDWLGSTAGRIQATRSSRSQYGQPVVFMAIRHISKQFRGFILTLLPQKPEAVPTGVSYPVLMIRWYLCTVAKPMRPNHSPVQCSQT